MTLTFYWYYPAQYAPPMVVHSKQRLVGILVPIFRGQRILLREVDEDFIFGSVQLDGPEQRSCEVSSGVGSLHRYIFRCVWYIYID